MEGARGAVIHHVRSDVDILAGGPVNLVVSMYPGMLVYNGIMNGNIVVNIIRNNKMRKVLALLLIGGLFAFTSCEEETGEECYACSGLGICYICAGTGLCTICYGYNDDASCYYCHNTGKCQDCKGKGSCPVCKGKGYK